MSIKNSKKKSSFSKKKKVFLLFILGIALFFVFSLIDLPEAVAQADPNPLQLGGQYPIIRDIEIALGMPLGDLFRYIYYFFVIISGVIVFAILVLAGFKWLTSAGNPGKMRAAKDQILSSFLGLIVLLGSYLILTTIDPKLVVMPLEPLTVEKHPIQPEPLKDGIILHTNHSDIRFKKIEIPEGQIEIIDIRNFPANGRIIDLSGKDIYGNFQATIDHIEKIEFRNPPYVPEALEQADANAFGNAIYYYGIICFEKSDFQGRARAFLSDPSQPITIHNLTAHSEKYFPCASFFSFRQPGKDFPTFVPGDNIIFFRDPFPLIERDPETNEVIDRACIRIGTDLKEERRGGIENCNIDHHYLDDGKNKIKINSLRGITEEGGRWFPLSMRVRTGLVRSYLLLLFAEINFRGKAYALWSDVPDFGSYADRHRLYWLDLNIGPEPGSVQIFPIQHF